MHVHGDPDCMVSIRSSLQCMQRYAHVRFWTRRYGPGPCTRLIGLTITGSNFLTRRLRSSNPFYIRTCPQNSCPNRITSLVRPITMYDVPVSTGILLLGIFSGLAVQLSCPDTTNNRLHHVYTHTMRMRTPPCACRLTMDTARNG